MPILEIYKALNSSYDRLRIANERLREDWPQYCRLMTLKLTLTSERSLPSRVQWEQFNSYRRSGFGDQIPFESEWWATHHDRLTYWSDGRRMPCSKLNEDLQYLETSNKDFEVMQGNIRDRINELSRPYLRDLSILDLPNELLLEVFNHFEYRFDRGPPCRDWPSGLVFGGWRVQYVKNIRLVCRRFHDLGSRYLIPIVTIGVSDESLTRLEKISHHPIFAKSVRLVCVVPHFYNAAFADFNRFISHHAAQLREEADYRELSLLVHGEFIDFEGISELVSNARAVASALEQFISPDDSIGGEMQQYRAQVDEIHGEYMAHLNNQELIMTSGRFSRVVAAAMTRMPGARDLKFGEADCYPARIHFPGYNVWDKVFNLMRGPVFGAQAQRDGLELPGYQCFVHLINTLRHTGVLLDGLDLHLSPIRTPGSFVLSPEMREELTLSMQHLVNFQCTVHCPTQRTGLNHTHGGDLNGFLSACLDNSNLQNIRLYTVCHNGRNSAETLDVFQVMGSRPRKKLTRLILQGTSIDLPELTVFLNALPESMTEFQLDGMRLRSGTWKQALDELRKKKYHHTKEEILRAPQGAECNFMSEEDVKKIFNTPYGSQHASEANRYILRQDPRQPNPL